MAQQEATVPWAKAHGWRVVCPTGVAVLGVGSGEGFSYQIHFTTNFLEIEAEKFQAEIDPTTRSVTQTGASSFHSPLLQDRGGLLGVTRDIGRRHRRFIACFFHKLQSPPKR